MELIELAMAYTDSNGMKKSFIGMVTPFVAEQLAQIAEECDDIEDITEDNTTFEVIAI